MWTIREGRSDEIERLVSLRCAMFQAMGSDQGTIDRVAEASHRYFSDQMASGTFRVWVAVIEEDEPIASIGLVIHSAPPRPSNLVGKTGYVMNLVTLPPWRRRGIARALLSHVIQVLREEGVPLVTLHASADGRSLYEELGFRTEEDLPAMRLTLNS